MSENPTIKQRIVFSIINCVSVYFLIEFIITYIIQDSSPKQTVALLRIVILIVVILAVYFFFFKITKNKFEDIGKIFLNAKNTGHLMISAILIITLGLIWSIQYQTYTNYKAMELSNATESLKKTLDSLHMPAADEFKSLL